MFCRAQIVLIVPKDTESYWVIKIPDFVAKLFDENSTQCKRVVQAFVLEISDSGRFLSTFNLRLLVLSSEGLCCNKNLNELINILFFQTAL